MSEWCIVAIPAKDDPVWQMSSEKVPHITLVYLGEQSDESKMGGILYEMASAAMSSLPRFGLPVLTRGKLGPKDADVLFFDEDYIGKLRSLRRRLIRGETIGELYNSTQQWPKWTPHLTMGFPNTPARSSDVPNWINFDRIALWTADDAGPELVLNNDPRKYQEDDIEVSDDGYAYHSQVVDAFLEHYGTPGMKWGVRKKDNIGVTRLDTGDGVVETHPLTKKAAKNPLSDNAAKTAEATFAVSRNVAERANDPNGKMQKLNQEWRSSGKGVDPAHKADYDSRVADTLTAEANEFTTSGSHARVHVVRVKGQKNPEIHLTLSDKDINEGYAEGLKRRSDVEMVHAKSQDNVIVLDTVLDDQGFITSVVDRDFQHSELLDNFLEHYGIPGMRWGIRRTDAQLARSKGGGKSDDDGPVAKPLSRKNDDGSYTLSSKGTDKDPEGTTRVVDVGGGPKLMKKRADGNWEETYLSADADRFLKTRNKSENELSDREVKEAIQRAKNIDQYNEMFNKPNREWQDKFAELEAQSKYAELNAKMNPSASTKVLNFVTGAGGTAYKAFDTIDKTLDGALSNQLKSTMDEALKAMSTSGGSTPRQPRAGKTPKPKKEGGLFGKKKKKTPSASGPTMPKVTKTPGAFKVHSMDDPSPFDFGGFPGANDPLPLSLPSGRS